MTQKHHAQTNLLCALTAFQLMDSVLIAKGEPTFLTSLLQYVRQDPRLNISAICTVFMLFLIGSVAPDLDQKIGIPHRTWTHSIWPVLILIVWGSLWPFAWAFALGYAGHLFWDSYGVWLASLLVYAGFLLPQLSDTLLSL